MSLLFARAVLAFLALPGIVAFAVPLLWMQSTGHMAVVYAWGLVPLIVGICALLWCVRDFYVSGKGTLAPWSPPRNLVVVGLYRLSRNPMYIAVTLILLGWAGTFGVRGLFIYALVVVVAFHLRVVLGEEPWLARTHGPQWTEYAARVPRWLF